jgi:hypothetical protein
MTTTRSGQFGPSQQEAALDLIDGMTWGDLGPAIHDVELCLQRALKATTRDLRNWEYGDFEQRFGDEFSLSDAQVVELSDEERFAYVARLVRSLALRYGLGLDGALGGLTGEAYPHSPAALLHGLDKLVDETLEEGER